MHKFQIIGHLGKDPEMRYTDSGKAVTSFSVATKNRRGKTLWARVVTWNDLAEACKKYLSKGDKVYAEGEFNFDEETGGPRIWGNEEARADYEINALTVEFLVTKGVEDRETPFDEKKKSKPKPPVRGKTEHPADEKAPWE